MRLYKFVDNGHKLELVHKTAVGGIPGALAAFKGRLLVGVGPILRLYDMGKKKLLRKSEYRRYASNPLPWLMGPHSTCTLLVSCDSIAVPRACHVTSQSHKQGSPLSHTL